MTVRHYQIAMPQVNQIGDLPTPTTTWRQLRRVEALSLVRHIMRERSDCTMIPTIVGGYKQYKPNTYGDSIFVHVLYAKKGYMATYGAVVDEYGRIVQVQCYMD